MAKQRLNKEQKIGVTESGENNDFFNLKSIYNKMDYYEYKMGF